MLHIMYWKPTLLHDGLTKISLIVQKPTHHAATTGRQSIKGMELTSLIDRPALAAPWWTFVVDNYTKSKEYIRARIPSNDLIDHRLPCSQHSSSIFSNLLNLVYIFAQSVYNLSSIHWQWLRRWPIPQRASKVTQISHPSQSRPKAMAILERLSQTHLLPRFLRPPSVDRESSQIRLRKSFFRMQPR